MNHRDEINVKWSRWFVVLTELLGWYSITSYDYAHAYGKNRMFPQTYALSLFLFTCDL